MKRHTFIIHTAVYIEISKYKYGLFFLAFSVKNNFLKFFSKEFCSKCFEYFFSFLINFAVTFFGSFFDVCTVIEK